MRRKEDAKNGQHKATGPQAQDAGPRTFVILTTAAAPAIADIHHRQPLILEDKAVEAWLKPGWAPNGLMETVLADCERVYERRRVSREVASPRNDWPELLAPLMTRASMGGTEEVPVALQ